MDLWVPAVLLAISWLLDTTNSALSKNSGYIDSGYLYILIRNDADFGFWIPYDINEHIAISMYLLLYYYYVFTLIHNNVYYYVSIMYLYHTCNYETLK